MVVSKCLTLHVPPHPTTPFLTQFSLSKTPRLSYSSTHLSLPSPKLKKAFPTPYNYPSPKHFPMKCSNSSNEFEFDPTLTNEDLKPTAPSQRTFSGFEIASLWVGLVVGVPSYYLAGSLVDLGMAWWQGIATVVAANMILLVPLVLTGHAGTLYGISFPVLARSSFGIHGAHVPTLLRALVGCGWYGIESWIGGEAIFLLLPNSVKETSLSKSLPWLGTSPLEFACFLVFWVAQLAFVWRGIDGIRKLENFWATVAINIPDFTRYAQSQKDQIIGQIGLPIFMGAFTFVGLAVTSSTKVIFGQVISDPIQLLGQIGGLTTRIIAIFGISLAIITTNIAANVVAPANALVNLSPKWFTFRRGALLTALLGIAFQPWRLLQSSESFVYTWLVGYSALLGPIAGIILADYYIIQKTNLNISDLYSRSPYGAYRYSGGFNIAAILALVMGVLPVVPGFLQKVGFATSVPHTFIVIYNNAWFISFFSAGFLYLVLSNLRGKPGKSAAGEPLLPTAK
uniref:Allantoin permease n=1 Tax=Cajanus cajan TaxID=3821 RepID=A0A151RK44_CAJCA|nr:putative allantoin permease [Cajanus cajan]